MITGTSNWVTIAGVHLVLPTEPEMLRIKAVLILGRNATRDHLDFAALSDRLGPEETSHALTDFDRLYPQDSGESALQQLQVQLARPLPYDLDETNLTEYRRLHPKTRALWTAPSGSSSAWRF